MKKKSNGFTLVELMIVVAVIGIIAAIAIPNFNRFHARSYQAEAKINLKGIYKAKKALFGEYSRYETDFADYDVERNNRYTYRTKNDILKSTNSEPAKAWDQGSNCSAAESDPSGTNDGGFTVNAAGQVDADTFIDGWYINDANCLVNGGCCSGCVDCPDNLNDVRKDS